LDIVVPFDRIAIVKKGWNVLAARTPEQLLDDFCDVI